MASLTLEGWPAWLQPPRDHLARTCVTDGAAKAEATGTRPRGQPAGGATAPEKASTTLCSQGPAEGKVESTQASAWACCPHPHQLEKNKCDVDRGSVSGANQEPSSFQNCILLYSPPAGGLLSAVIWRGPAEPRAGETVGGLEVSSSALPTWLGTRGTCSGK